MMCDETGGIIDDLVVYRLADEHFMVVANASNAETVLDELQARSEGFDVEVRDARDSWALIAVQGPASVDIIASLTDVHLAELKYYAVDEGTLARRDVLLARTGYTGEDGFEVYCDPADAIHIWDVLTKAGAPHGLVPTGLACRDTLRLEAGCRCTGTSSAALPRRSTPDWDESSPSPREASSWADKALEARQESGVKQQLVGLTSESRRSPRAGYKVLDEVGRVVGEVSSGAPSPTLGHPVALAYVQRANMPNPTPAS